MSRLLSILKRLLLAAIVLVAAVYAGDYALVRYRIAKNRNPYGTVRVRRYYVVTMKDGKPEYFFDQPNDQTCVHSLFPHLGYSPCWYLKRRPTQQVNM